jgi:hypothetical protein
MSRPVHEQLRELATDVRDLQVPPAAAVRARGRLRGRRQLTALVVAGVVVAATAGTVATRTLDRTHQDTAAAGGLPRMNCVLALPDDPAEVSIRVLGGGAAAGTPDATASQLRARRFHVLVGPADAGRTEAGPADAADLRYGPTAIGAATVVRAMVHGPVLMRFDPDRRDMAIDLVLGPAFTRLATTTEVNQGLAEAGEPTAPPQCLAAASPARGH